jgi:hypothetical protein
MSDPTTVARFSLADLDRWVARGLIGPEQVAVIRAEVATHPGVGSGPAAAVEQPAGLNAVTVAYGFGAAMILLAYTFFLGLQWEALGRPGQAGAACGTVVGLWAIGMVLRGRGYRVGGNLLAFAAVCIVPLTAYTLLRLLGWWPESDGASAYRDFYRRIDGNWVLLEAASIAAAVAAARRLRFPLLTLPIAFWAWYLSMDLTRLVAGHDDFAWGPVEWVVGTAVGAAMLAIGVRMQALHGNQDWSRWLYLFGHGTVLGNFGALTLDDGALLGLAFLAVYLGFVVASVRLQSRVFLAFGALGCYAYASKLAFDVFRGSLGFTFGLAFVGLLVVLSAVGYQRYARPWLERRLGPAGGSPASAA